MILFYYQVFINLYLGIVVNSFCLTQMVVCFCGVAISGWECSVFLLSHGFRGIFLISTTKIQIFI